MKKKIKIGAYILVVGMLIMLKVGLLLGMRINILGIIITAESPSFLQTVSENDVIVDGREIPENPVAKANGGKIPGGPNGNIPYISKGTVQTRNDPAADPNYLPSLFLPAKPINIYPR